MKEEFKDYAVKLLAEVVTDALEWNIGSPANPGWRRRALAIMDEVGYYDALTSNAKNPFWNGEGCND